LQFLELFTELEPEKLGDKEAKGALETMGSRESREFSQNPRVILNLIQDPGA